MAQTTGAMNTVNGLIEVSANGSSWTDISGSTNKVEAPSQDADTGEAATLDGQYMIGATGKFKPLDISVTVLYTEVADEAYDFIKTQAAIDGRPLYLRWSPAGGEVGDQRFFTANAAGVLAAGSIASMPFPGADAAQAAPTVLMFKVRATTLGEETISA